MSFSLEKYIKSGIGHLIETNLEFSVGPIRSQAISVGKLTFRSESNNFFGPPVQFYKT